MTNSRRHKYNCQVTPVEDVSLQVSVLLSRDLDSRVTPREAAAVREWLGSGKAVHSMRRGNDVLTHMEKHYTYQQG